MRQYYEQKPAVQVVINVCKSLMTQMQSALSVLGPVYGSREWSSTVDEKALKAKILHEAGGTFKYGGRTGPNLSPKDEYMGELQTRQAFGNIVVEA